MRLMLWLCVLKPVARQHGVSLLGLQIQVRNLSERSLTDRTFVCGGRPDTQKPFRDSTCDWACQFRLRRSVLGALVQGLVMAIVVERA